MTEFLTIEPKAFTGFDNQASNGSRHDQDEITLTALEPISWGVPPSQTRTVAIVGFAGSSREQVNDEPETTEVWGLNSGYTFMKRKADVWFDVHGYQGRDDYREEHWQKMLDMGVPIYALHPPVPRPENVYRLDYSGICEKLGVKPYFTNSIAYMITFAIDQGVDELKLFGVDMATGTEFASQRACCEYWLGIAQGRGIKVHVADASPILRGLQYGVDRDDGFNRAKLLDYASQLRQQDQKELSTYWNTEGQHDAVRGLVEAFTAYENDHDGVIEVENIRGIMAATLEDIAKRKQEALNQCYTVGGASQIVRKLLNEFYLPDTSHGELELAIDAKETE